MGVPRPLRPRCPTMSLPLTLRDPMSQTARNALIAGGVVLLHAAALWALQAGLLRRAAEIIVPVELISAIVTPPAAPAPPVQRPAAAEPVPRQVERKTLPAPAPAPRPVAAPDPTPAPAAPSATSEPQHTAPPLTTPMTASPAPAPRSGRPAARRGQRSDRPPACRRNRKPW